MKQRLLGKAMRFVGEIGMGTWPLGGEAYGPVDEKDALAAIRRACELGVSFFDTADVYGNGRSEELLGRALGANRHRVLIATKVGNDFYGRDRAAGSGGPAKNFTPDYIAFACEQSLRRLRTDYIDLYQLHSPPSEEVGRDEVWGALERLRSQGKVRVVGASVSRVDDARAACERNAQAMQFTYNLLDRELAKEIAPLAKSFGAAVIARSPLCYGLLGGRYAPGHRFPPGDTRHGRWPEEVLDERLARARDYARRARENGFTAAQLAIRYCLAAPEVSAVIPGMKNVAQVEELVAAADRPLPAELLEAL